MSDITVDWLRENKKLVAHIPWNISPDRKELVLANMSDKWEGHEPQLYEFVVWRLDADGNCYLGDYFVGHDPLEEFANAVKQMLIRAGIMRELNRENIA
jgi:hypothetical protein